MNKTQIVTCSCVNAYQDAEYGAWQRVTTPVNKEQQAKRLVVRCTVCGREQSLGNLK